MNYLLQENGRLMTVVIRHMEDRCGGVELWSEKQKNYMQNFESEVFSFIPHREATAPSFILSPPCSD